jgi:large subunit ribosomal protein L15
MGKTAGRVHKGQKARAGGFHKVGFEGGQMPLQRRLPKVGFISKKKSQSAHITVNQLRLLPADETIDVQSLKAVGLVGYRIKRVKIINTGELNCQPLIKGVAVTKSVFQRIISAGGKVEA